MREGSSSFGSFVASHLASAAFTATGFSCAIQWPDFTTTSVRSAQSRRIGSASRECTVSQVVVVGAVQEQHRHREPAAVRRALGVGAVGLVVHVPGVRPEEAVARQRRDVGLHVLLGDARRHRAAGRAQAPPPNQPPALRTAAVARRLADAVGIALAEQRLHDVADVGLEAAAAPCRSSPRRRTDSPTGPPDSVGLGIDRAVDQRQPFSSVKPARDRARRGSRRRPSCRDDAPPCSTPPGCPSRGRSTPPCRGRARPAARACRRRSAPARSPRAACRCSSGRSRACRARCSGSRARRTPAADAATTARAPASHGRRSAAAPPSAPQAR